jgi:hypothetical protein
MTPVGFDERLAMAAQQLLRTHVVPLGWPAEAGDDSAMQQALQPSESCHEICCMTDGCTSVSAIDLGAAALHKDLGWEFESLHAVDEWTPAGDILAARIAQMQAAADEAADAEPQEVAVPSYMEVVLQCAAERRALLRGALHALWGW